jgi:hypothetical protein
MQRYVSHVWKGFVVSIVLLLVFGSSVQGIGLRAGEGFPASQNFPEFGIIGGTTSRLEGIDVMFEMTSFRQVPLLFDVAEMAVSAGNASTDLEFYERDGMGSESLMAFQVTTSRTVRLSANVREPGGESGSIDFTFALEEPPMISELLPGLRKIPLADDVRLNVPAEEYFVPEPASLLLVGLGLLGIIMGLRWRTWR